MDKSTGVSILIFFIVLLLIVAAVAAEQIYLKVTFSAFSEKLNVLTDKVNAGSATEADVVGLHEWWKERKEILHVVIPHIEIKEVESPLSELKVYVGENDKTEALAKLEYLKDLAEMIPDTFDFSFGNIF